MSGDDKAAFVVALHRASPLPLIDPVKREGLEAAGFLRSLTREQKERWLRWIQAPIGPERGRELLQDFRVATFDRADPVARRLDDLRKDVLTALEYGAKAVDAIRRGQRSAAAIRVAEHQLGPLLDELTRQLSFEFEREEGSVTSLRPSGRLRVPLHFGYVARNPEAALGLAVIQQINGGKKGGLCPYCDQWWITADARRRTTCGTRECDARRKNAWRRKHREPQEEVRARVQDTRRRDRAWRMSEAGRSLEEIAEALGVDRITANNYRRQGRERAKARKRRTP